MFKKTHRRLLGLGLAVILGILCSFAAFAAQGSLSFSDPSVTVGEEVDVTVKVEADAGTAINDANIVLQYPSDKLEFVSGTDSDGGAGTIRIHGASNGKGTANLEYTLKFNALSAGTANITVSDEEIYDSDGARIELTHRGNSEVTINAGESVSSDSSLSSLEVYPGELSPAFSADITTYSITVGSGVERLAINALPSDSGASVSISGNDSLPMGDSTVTIAVSAPDGTSQYEYLINVSKVEGGSEAVVAETTVPEIVEGVQLSSKGKTITIMSPGEDVEIPEGFRAGTIRIDDQSVQGWVWGSDEEPEYCVVYGMNDKGEINFYRYDMVEKTIQRYFEDPIATGAVTGAEHQAVIDERDAALELAGMRFIAICVLAAICFVLVIVIIYMNLKLRNARNSGRRSAASNRIRDRRSRMEESSEETSTGFAKPDEMLVDRNLLKHNYANVDEEGDVSSGNDETQVIRRPDRKRRSRRSSYMPEIDETQVITRSSLYDTMTGESSEDDDQTSLDARKTSDSDYRKTEGTGNGKDPDFEDIEL